MSAGMRTCRRLAALALVVVQFVAAVALAQAPEVPTKSRPAPMSTSESAELDRLLQARRFTEAERILERRVADGDRDPIVLYNSACVLAQLGKLSAAEKRLLEAIKAGFRDFDTMERDTDLEPVRASDTYEAIMEARARIEAERAPRGKPRAPSGGGRRGSAPDPVAQWKRDHPEAFGEKAGYRYERDDESSITYATFLDESSHRRMRQVLDELEKHLIASYFGKAPTDALLVAIVRPEDAKKYLERPEVRGMYLHSARRLVSRDAGQSLQHEFVHLMHFAHMERTGQRHPIWVQEGLASLYEDYTLRADGSIEFHPNIRFNFARKQVTSRTARSWRELFELSNEQFMEDAERHYPQVRAIFEFFAREGKLEEFYRELGRTIDEDPDASSAVEKAFGQPLAKVEERWRKWMVERGSVDDRIERDDASFGIVIEDSGDGVRIREFRYKSAARAAGLRVGDVIFEVDGLPVRNRDEMLMAVTRLVVGRQVVVRYKRDDKELSAKIAPRPLGE